MPNLPTLGQANWGETLNNFLTQSLDNNNGGGINKFDIFSLRPTTLGADDKGKTYLYTQTGNFHQWTGTEWKVLNESVINVKDYGAVGDDSGKTPTDTGVDISTASWNIWPDFLTGGNLNASEPNYAAKKAEIEAYNSWGSLTPPYPKPFTNIDSWDYIGIQLALWQSHLKSPTANIEVYIPAGNYKLTREIRYTVGIRATLRGAGILQSILKFKDITSFPTVYKGEKTLLYIYRVGGVPTSVSDLGFHGEYEESFANNINLVVCANTNAVHLDRCWFSTAKVGVLVDDNNSDFFLTNSTAEYCSIALKGSSGDTMTVNDNNFWQTIDSTIKYTGIESTGRCIIRDNNFYLFANTSIITGPKSQICDNYFYTSNCFGVATLDQDSIFSGNIIETSGALGAQLTLSSNCVVNSNQFLNSSSQHGCINLRKNIAVNKGSLILGNIFKINAGGLAPSAGTGIIFAENPGSDYSTGAENCMIANNNFTKTIDSTIPDMTLNQGNNTIINNLTNT